MNDLGNENGKRMSYEDYKMSYAPDRRIEELTSVLAQILVRVIDMAQNDGEVSNEQET